jgi:hypothetical protein
MFVEGASGETTAVLESCGVYRNHDVEVQLVVMFVTTSEPFAESLRSHCFGLFWSALQGRTVLISLFHFKLL